MKPEEKEREAGGDTHPLLQQEPAQPFTDLPATPVGDISTAALFDALSYAAQCTEARKRELLLRRLRAI